MADYLSPIQISAGKLFTELSKVLAYVRYRTDEESFMGFMMKQHCVENLSFINKLLDVEECLIKNDSSRLLFMIDYIYNRHVMVGSFDEINISDTYKANFIVSRDTLHQQSKITNSNLKGVLDALYPMLIEVKKILEGNLRQAVSIGNSPSEKHLAQKLSSGASDASAKAHIPNITDYILPSSQLVCETGHAEIPDDIQPRPTIQIKRGINLRLI